MHKIAVLATAVTLCAAALADVFALKPGLNSIAAARGELAAADAVTTNASASIAVKSVRTVYAYTNAFVDVTTEHEVFSFTITNFDGNAAIATNVWDTFSYDDWTTNGVSMIVGPVTPSTTNVTETVPDGRRISETFVVTNDLLTITASDHYGIAAPETTTYVLGGQYLVTGSGEDDVVTILIK